MFLAAAVLAASVRGDMAAELRKAGAQLTAAAPQLQRSGVDVATFVNRLNVLGNEVDSADGVGAQQTDTLRREVALELEIRDDLVKGALPPPRALPGAHIAWVRGSDGSAQPLGVYVPHGAAGDLVVVLHGRHETEANVIAHTALQQLAEEARSVVVVPYARGIDDFRGIAASDVVAATRAAQQTFGISAAHTYLMGFSMGGAALFRIGSLDQRDFAGYLCALGAVEGADRHDVLAQMRDAKFYLVAGGADSVVPATWVRGTGKWLRRNGIVVSYYEQPNAEHSWYDITPALRRAWTDMVSGIVREGDDLGPVLEQPQM